MSLEEELKALRKQLTRAYNRVKEGRNAQSLNAFAKAIESLGKIERLVSNQRGVTEALKKLYVMSVIACERIAMGSTIRNGDDLHADLLVGRDYAAAMIDQSEKTT